MPVMAAATTVVHTRARAMISTCTRGGEARRSAAEGVYILENPRRLYTVTRCALSAHTLPRITILSHLVICASLSRNLACRSLATFSAGVSAGGALPWTPFFGSVGGGGARTVGLSRTLGLGRGVLEAEYVEGEARLMGEGLA